MSIIQIGPHRSGAERSRAEGWSDYLRGRAGLGDRACRRRVSPEDFTIRPPPFSCLAIETASALPSVALLRAGEMRVREVPGLRSPSRSVYEWVRELLDEADTSLDQLDCIAFGAGPGSFTGVRVAVALSQALGYACRLPLCPVSTLAALAAGVVRTTGHDAVACCLDARLGEVYFAVYAKDREQGVRVVSPDALLQPEAVRLPAQGMYLAAGPGWSVYPELTDRLRSRFSAVDAAYLPSAVDVARLAGLRFLAGELVSAADASPNYLRERVASTSAERQADQE